MRSERPEESENAVSHAAQKIVDSSLIARLQKAVIRKAGGEARFKREIPSLLRKAIDEVIDSPRTGRFTLDETEKTEKTYLGTKVEILLRNFLKIPKGEKLDLSVDGTETDIKNTMHANWMIPSEAIDHPCILLRTDEASALFSIGIIIARLHFLGSGQNKDGKKSFSKSGRDAIHWILKDEPYPKNFWQDFSTAVKRKIIAPTSGTRRVDALFRNIQRTPIPRTVVLAVAKQKDAMKRLRKNGGARDSLARDGIAILSGHFDKALIERFGLPRCKKDEFISYEPKSDSDKSLLHSLGKIS